MKTWEERQNYSCCFTGYRPQKYPFPLVRGNADFDALENALTETVFSLCEEHCDTFYTGMAMGFDLIAAEAVLFWKRAKPEAHIKLIAVLPFSAQADTFSPAWKERFDAVLRECDGEVWIEREYRQGCYARRNRYMVDHSDFVVTWYDGQKGGTQNTLLYAKKLDRSVINLNTAYGEEGDQLPLKLS